MVQVGGMLALQLRQWTGELLPEEAVLLLPHPRLCAPALLCIGYKTCARTA